MTQPSATAGELSWLLDDLLARAEGTRHAIVLSTDGLLMASSSQLERSDAEHLAAISSSLQSLARGACRQFGAREVRQSVIEMDEALLFVATAGEGACLALVSSAECDVGLVAYEMSGVIRRVGQYLSAPPRPDLNAVSASFRKQ
ncbi:roadblock/LC7 domain-containing protein [Lipingzhangella sp. LS1_29]|uniref:Roadblock/LC7 domain-containing protein n=1 Tax=Lipingzhangella rawalii TaxID=2055835 RepID=A0ABU2H402_9ACTN|nr:roadblock/LC7 domain-containing protein [Lipingzhangella rawalii]MDS1269589.1 roadblock/LC7 domain-containing protein [Lipingzhangella rawalii]